MGLRHTGMAFTVGAAASFFRSLITMVPVLPWMRCPMIRLSPDALMMFDPEDPFTRFPPHSGQNLEVSDMSLKQNGQRNRTYLFSSENGLMTCIFANFILEIVPR